MIFWTNSVRYVEPAVDETDHHIFESKGWLVEEKRATRPQWSRQRYSSWPGAEKIPQVRIVERRGGCRDSKVSRRGPSREFLLTTACSTKSTYSMRQDFSARSNYELSRNDPCQDLTDDRAGEQEKRTPDEVPCLPRNMSTVKFSTRNNDTHDPNGRPRLVFVNAQMRDSSTVRQVSTGRREG